MGVEDPCARNPKLLDAPPLRQAFACECQRSEFVVFVGGYKVQYEGCGVWGVFLGFGDPCARHPESLDAPPLLQALAWKC